MLPKRAKISQLESDWDLVVVGGGITGAGIALLASQLNLKVLLVEQRDYAWGTSSRSSKMVHGGLRYLSQGDIKLTRESLRERELLLKQLPGLVHREPYLFPIYKGQFPGRWAMKAALWFYDFLAGIRQHKWLNLDELKNQAPQFDQTGVLGAMRYTDAITDDSRLVVRVLQEAAANGAELINYVKAKHISAVENGSRVELVDALSEEHKTVHAKQVINATGLWADELSDTEAKIRPLRGSHLLLSADKLPISACMTLLHPEDKRPVFVFPWCGVTVVGTTDLDHQQDKDREAYATAEEIDYLFTALNHAFPALDINRNDLVSTQSGVRPVIASGSGKDPSKERRDHLVWQAPGRITVSGGKLTTFRVIALDALHAAGFIDKAQRRQIYKQRHLFHYDVKWPSGLGDITAAIPTEDLVKKWWRWAIRHEQVVRLDDLMLRRTRVGNVFVDGGLELLQSNRQWLAAQLGWSESHWQSELQRYEQIWRSCYQIRQ